MDYSPNHADLAWSPPETDGGAPITHYIIEQKEKNMGQWVEGKVLTVKEVEAMGNKIKGKIGGLVEGCEYQFRIRAVNKGGPSIPGPPSESMIAKHRFIPPHIIGDGIFDLTLKKGRPIRYDIWFGGEPAPSCEWLRNGRTLTSDENTSIELYSKNTIYTERNTVMSIPKVSHRPLLGLTLLTSGSLRPTEPGTPDGTPSSWSARLGHLRPPPTSTC